MSTLGQIPAAGAHIGATDDLIGAISEAADEVAGACIGTFRRVMLTLFPFLVGHVDMQS